MTFAQAISTCFSKYVTFSGRAARSEFWYFTLFLVLAGIVFGVIDAIVFGTEPEDGQLFSAVFSLATILPSISVTVRRLHDGGRSGWWWWLWLIPLVGWIILLIWYIQKGTDGPNDYGPDPLDPGASFAPDYSVSKSSIPSVRRDDE